MTPADVRAMWPAFEEAVRGARRILIATHLNPDGDALGSALGAAGFLKGRGIECEVLDHDAAPSYLRFLPGADEIRRTPANPEFDLAIVLDLDALDRLGSVRPYVEACPRIVLIDHHVPHEQPGDLRIVAVQAPATAAILADLFLASGEALSADVANCLLTGILTDTGSFRFPNSTAHSLHLAAALIELGADLTRISEEVYQTKPFASVRLLGRAIEKARLDEGRRLVWSVLAPEDFDACGADEEHTEGIVNELLAIDSVEIAAVLREGKPGKIRGSLRSKGDHDVAEAARQFGGGGHRNAAGVSFTGDLGEAEATLVAALKQCLASS